MFTAPSRKNLRCGENFWVLGFELLVSDCSHGTAGFIFGDRMSGFIFQRVAHVRKKLGFLLSPLRYAAQNNYAAPSRERENPARV